MGLIDRQTGLLVAATAVATSPEARRVARQGVVYGVAGALKAGDFVVSAARGAARGAQAGLSGDGPPQPQGTEEPVG
jgi:hypothetical protein